MEGKCQTSGLIYQATVKQENNNNNNNNEETYIGLADTTFKLRYNNHTCSFNNRHKSKETELSKHIWDLKDKNIPYSVTWKIIDRCKSYSPISKSCNLCIREKYYIIRFPHLASINSRNELTSTCRHRRKFLLCNT